jgi:hypothetical protein
LWRRQFVSRGLDVLMPAQFCSSLPLLQFCPDPQPCLLLCNCLLFGAVHSFGRASLSFLLLSFPRPQFPI